MEEQEKAVFTNEALKILENQANDILLDLKKSAIEEALQARGLPVEVTASDVKRVISNTYIRKKTLKFSTDFVLKVYMVLGIVLFVVALVYQPIVDFYRHLSGDILPLLLSVLGLVLAISSYFMRELLSKRYLKHDKDSNRKNK